MPLTLVVLEYVRSLAYGVDAPVWGGEKEGKEGVGNGLWVVV